MVNREQSIRAGRYVVLDVRRDDARLFSVDHAGGRPVISLIGTIDLADPAATELPRDVRIATGVKCLMGKCKTPMRYAVILVDGQSVFSRLVKLPPVSPEKQLATIRHEAVQNIPFSLDEVVWDYQLSDADALEPEVLLVAVKSEMLQGLLQAVMANDLIVDRVAVGPIALVNAVRCAMPGHESLLLVDVVGESANLIFVDEPKFFFRTLPVGQSDRLMNEIERSLGFYVGQHGGRPVSKILVTASVAPEAGKIKEKFNVEVVELCLGDRVQSDLEGDGCEPVAGIALQDTLEDAVSINLIPEAVRRVRGSGRRMFLYAISLLLLMLGMAFWIWELNASVASVRNYQKTIHGKIQALERIEKQMLPVEKTISTLMDQGAALQDVSRRRVLWLEVFGELGRVIPEGMFVIESAPLKEDQQVVGLRVKVVSYLDKEPQGEDVVKRLRNKLRESAQFSDETKVHSRPSKLSFARSFVMDIYFEEVNK